MKLYHLAVGIKGDPDYEIADIRTYSIEEALVKAAIYLGWDFDSIEERF